MFLYRMPCQNADSRPEIIDPTLSYPSCVSWPNHRKELCRLNASHGHWQRSSRRVARRRNRVACVPLYCITVRKGDSFKNSTDLDCLQTFNGVQMRPGEVLACLQCLHRIPIFADCTIISASHVSPFIAIYLLLPTGLREESNPLIFPDFA